MEVSGKLVAETVLVLALVVAVAVVAGLADYRQRKRVDLDRVSLLDWRSVQLLSLIAGVIALVAVRAL